MNHTVPYPRICAHRGLSALYPENTPAAFEAAIAAGAQEIEFDLRPAPDGTIVVRHDPIDDTCIALPAFEDVLAQFARRVIMNIHVKQAEIVQGVAEAIARHDCREYIYIAGAAPVMEAALALAPGLERCCLEGSKDGTIVRHAIRFGAQKLQARPRWLTREMIDQAHARGIRCNLFYTDDPAQARAFFRMGIDTVLTNNCQRIMNALKNQEETV